MAATPTGGVTGGGAAGGDIALDFDDLRKIGEQTAETSARATSAGSRVRGARGGHGAFSAYPLAQELAAQHDAVADVFSQTLEALSQEMEEFGVAVKQCATNYADADDGIQGALTSIVSRLTSANTVSSQQTYDSARTDAGSRLLSEDEAALDDATVAIVASDADAADDATLSSALAEATGADPTTAQGNTAPDTPADTTTHTPQTAF